MQSYRYSFLHHDFRKSLSEYIVCKYLFLYIMLLKKKISVKDKTGE